MLAARFVDARRVCWSYRELGLGEWMAVGQLRIGHLRIRHLRIVHEIQAVSDDFEVRFQDLSSITDLVTLMVNPFNESLEAETAAQRAAHTFAPSRITFKDELHSLRANIILKARFIDANFWKLMPPDQYLELTLFILELQSRFGSTYLSESAFSQMKIIKATFRSSLTDAHLEVCLRLAVSSLSPNLRGLLDDMRSTLAIHYYHPKSPRNSTP